MLGLNLNLEWPRCPDGVILHDYGERDPDKPLLSGEPSGKYIRYRTTRQIKVTWEIKNLESPIVLSFVNSRDDDSLIGFLSRHGLTSGGWTAPDGAREIEWGNVKRDQRALRTLLFQLDGGEPIETAVKRINTVLARRQHFALVPALYFSEGAAEPRLGLRPQTLLGFMLTEIAMIAAAGARTKLCRHCGSLITTGHLTGRRSSAIYCGDRCRVAAMRKRQKAEAK